MKTKLKSILAIALCAVGLSAFAEPQKIGDSDVTWELTNEAKVKILLPSEGVMMRGKAVQGEKTMLDAMIPARDAIEASMKAGKTFAEALKDGVQAARDGVEYTKTIIATKGRAAYVGERSIGHQDPGATSFTYLLEVISDTVNAQ